MAKEESSRSADGSGGKDQPADFAGSSGRTRSPNFPSMDLKKAVEKTEILHRHNKRFSVPALAALKHLGYSTAGSSGALQTIGALKAYGLIETDGAGEERKIRVSEAGAQIVLGHPNRDTILKKAA